MVEGDADLEDALVEAADGARLGHPQVFEGLVAFEELAQVEFVYGDVKLWWRLLPARLG
jgi:hypothetical protein